MMIKKVYSQGLVKLLSKVDCVGILLQSPSEDGKKDESMEPQFKLFFQEWRWGLLCHLCLHRDIYSTISML